MARTRQAWVKGDKSIAIASLKESLMKNPSQVDRTRLLSALHQATEVCNDRLMIAELTKVCNAKRYSADI